MIVTECGSGTKRRGLRLGTEYDGEPVHDRPEGFHGSITAVKTTHRFNPPSCPQANADAIKVR